MFIIFTPTGIWILTLGAKRYERGVERREPRYKEYVLNLPKIEYTFEKVEFQSYSDMG